MFSLAGGNTAYAHRCHDPKVCELVLFTFLKIEYLRHRCYVLSQPCWGYYFEIFSTFPLQTFEGILHLCKMIMPLVLQTYKSSLGDSTDLTILNEELHGWEHWQPFQHKDSSSTFTSDFYSCEKKKTKKTHTSSFKVGWDKIPCPHWAVIFALKVVKVANSILDTSYSLLLLKIINCASHFCKCCIAVCRGTQFQYSFSSIFYLLDK